MNQISQGARVLSIKAKMVIALIGLALVAVGVAGLSARAITLKRFDDLVANRARFDFMDQVVAYYRKYGSWEAAAEQETYFEFIGQATAARRPGRPGAPGGIEGGMTGAMSGPVTGPGADAPNLPVARVGGAPPFVVADLDGKIWISGQTHETGDFLPENQLRYTLPIMDDNNHIGYVIPAQVAVVVELAAEAERAITASWWYSALIALGITIPAGVFLGTQLASPIKRLHLAVVAMQPGAVQQEVPVVSRDELGELSNSFNIMSSEMASFVDIIEQQRQKIMETEALRKEGMASFSHELRTPLNSCVAQASAMMDGIRPRNDEQMQVLSDSLDHLTSLVDDLFQLALADVNALDCAEEVVNLGELAEDVVKARSSDFETKGSVVDLDIPQHLPVVGDPKRLRQIIDNLLENSHRYARANGKVGVRLRPAARFAELTVVDDGPGVPEEKLESLFDRFFRVEGRSESKSRGTGLGLSLVKAWAEAQGGSVDAFLSAEGGLGIKVYVPLAKGSGLGSMRAYG